MDGRRDSELNSELVQAVMDDNFLACQAIFERVAPRTDPNRKQILADILNNPIDSLGRTVLELAIENGAIRVVEYILNTPEINLEKQNANGLTPTDFVKSKIDALRDQVDDYSKPEAAESAEKILPNIIKISKALDQKIRDNKNSASIIQPKKMTDGMSNRQLKKLGANYDKATMEATAKVAMHNLIDKVNLNPSELNSRNIQKYFEIIAEGKSGNVDVSRHGKMLDILTKKCESVGPDEALDLLNKFKGGIKKFEKTLDPDRLEKFHGAVAMQKSILSHEVSSLEKQLHTWQNDSDMIKNPRSMLKSIQSYKLRHATFLAGNMEAQAQLSQFKMGIEAATRATSAPPLSRVSDTPDIAPTSKSAPLASNAPKNNATAAEELQRRAQERGGFDSARQNYEGTVKSPVPNGLSTNSSPLQKRRVIVKSRLSVSAAPKDPPPPPPPSNDDPPKFRK